MGDFYFEIAIGIIGALASVAALIAALAWSARTLATVLSKREDEHEDTLKRLQETERRVTESEISCRQAIRELDDKWRSDNHKLQVENLQLLGHIKDLECRIIELEHENERRRDKQVETERLKQEVETLNSDLKAMIESQSTTVGSQEALIKEQRATIDELRAEIARLVKVAKTNENNATNDSSAE